MNVTQTKIIEMKDEEGNVIFIETNIDQSSLELVAGNDGEMLKALTKFEESLDPVINLSKAVIKRINGISVTKPSELELNFSLKLSGKLDFWVISANGEGNISLKLNWKIT